MILNCQITLSFNFEDSYSDGIGEAQTQALNFIRDNITADEESNPINIHDFTILNLGEKK